MNQKDFLVIVGTAVICLFAGRYFLLPTISQEKPLVERQEPAPPFVPPVEPEREPSPPEPPRVVEPEYVDVPVVSQRIREESLYADIMNRQSNPFTSEDRDTNAHETTHGINSDLRNQYARQLRKKVNGFYVTGGKGVIIEEPNIRKSAVIPFLPPALRSYRYNLYIQGQGAWDDVPLYLVDEWVAYVNGGAVSVEDVEKGRHNGQWSDSVSGCLDFSIYCVALCMAVETGDPEYWENNTQFRNFMRWHLEKAHDVFMKGRNMEQFRWDKQEKLLESLRNSEAGKPMRDFLNRHFDGLWLEATPNNCTLLLGRQGNRNILDLLRERSVRYNHSTSMYFSEP